MFCEEHTDAIKSLSRIEQICKDTSNHIDRLDSRINGAFVRIEKHVDEGDKKGGFRERLVKLETLVVAATEEKLNSTKASQWRIGLIAGIPGVIATIILIVFKIINMATK